MNQMRFNLSYTSNIPVSSFTTVGSLFAPRLIKYIELYVEKANINSIIVIFHYDITVQFVNN